MPCKRCARLLSSKPPSQIFRCERRRGTESTSGLLHRFVSVPFVQVWYSSRYTIFSIGAFATGSQRCHRLCFPEPVVADRTLRRRLYGALRTPRTSLQEGVSCGSTRRV